MGMRHARAHSLSLSRSLSLSLALSLSLSLSLSGMARGGRQKGAKLTTKGPHTRMQSCECRSNGSFEINSKNNGFTHIMRPNEPANEACSRACATAQHGVSAAGLTISLSTSNPAGKGLHWLDVAEATRASRMQLQGCAWCGRGDACSAMAWRWHGSAGRSALPVHARHAPDRGITACRACQTWLHLRPRHVKIRADTPEQPDTPQACVYVPRAHLDTRPCTLPCPQRRAPSLTHE